MLKVKIIWFVLLLFPFMASTQVIKARVPRQLIFSGESFSMQYILEDLRSTDQLIYPTSRNFRVISGPYESEGSESVADGTKPVKIISFTLVANKPGRFVLESPKIKTNNKVIGGGSVIIDVIDKKEMLEREAKQVNSEYFLQPGEDPSEKIRKNLFMKVMVNKRECYVGEPILATFKLYSRLTSRSDIVKNPGFYGFTVQDIVNLNDNIVATETVNGRPFDVHTIRTVQLYPLRPGLFVVDPMEVMNKVEFSKSAVNKKTEQEIVEGVYEKKDPPHNENTLVFENSISTEKIIIHVKALPEIKKPPTFNGATGNFSIMAGLVKNELARNEEGALIITIKGKGNFTQLSPPVIEWPNGIENFEPVIKDSLDKTSTPLKGSRTFRFPFLSSKTGNYSIPPISFSFFNPDSGHYKSITTNSADLRILNAEKKEMPKHQQTAMVTEKRDFKSLWIYTGISLVVLVIIFLQLRKPKKQPVASVMPEKEIMVSTEQLLQPARFALMAGDNNFHSLLQKTIWDHFSPLLNLSGSKKNKVELYKAMKEKNIDETLCRNLLGILDECEAALFTKAELAHNKQELLNRTKTLLDEIKV